jgi:aminobutyraldehyde dehydrogenase
MQTKLLIDGVLITGEGPVERVLDPATGKCIAEVPEASPRQVDAAVAAAEAAALGWAQTVPKDRATLLLRLADRIEADGAAFAKLESDNTGKPLSAALPSCRIRACAWYLLPAMYRRARKYSNWRPAISSAPT